MEAKGGRVDGNDYGWAEVKLVVYMIVKWKVNECFKRIYGIYVYVGDRNVVTRLERKQGNMRY